MQFDRTSAKPKQEPCKQTQEIERKFLVDLDQVPPEVLSSNKQEILQGYLVATADVEVRLRKADSDYFLTIKSSGDLIRNEWELPISQQQFESWWPQTEERRVEKTRHSFALGSLTGELDLYSGTLNGLVVVEVEFDSEVESKNFVPPRWFGKEVTANSAYKNKRLALNGRPENG